ncbi:hypothetical protein [Nannocystis exedens]|uniref:hypothetical protein n=1 Tax=Nannocystis exedens TaxID=54 RepID=UPI001160C8A3|nr:hypothetical protein [Nannocystis exedens]
MLPRVRDRRPDLAAFAQGRPEHQHFTATLLVEGGQVFVAHAELLVAFSLETGQQLWQRRVERAAAGSIHVSVSLAVPGLAQQGDRK